ncbi:MAG TPA: hypothetical protein VJ848_07735, partial [Candidatus Angelobacter sp.]|nr:hypothetical protein [Candidatus Angelobacter sp.]
MTLPKPHYSVAIVASFAVNAVGFAFPDHPTCPGAAVDHPITGSPDHPIKRLSRCRRCRAMTA